MESYRFNQIKIITAITEELNRQHPGLPADERMNTIIKAANEICAEYAREPVAASRGMGLTAWLGGDDTGFTDIKIEGYSFTGCSQDDVYHTEFIATGQSGNKVKGVVCGGWLKGSTIRFN